MKTKIFGEQILGILGNNLIGFLTKDLGQVKEETKPPVLLSLPNWEDHLAEGGGEYL